jgi:ABC-type bacteriocin/lantibiotic exporter with double-glycine peptidase domain
MKPIQRFRRILIADRSDFYQLLIFAVLAGLISLSIPLGIQSIINFIQAGQYSASWIVIVFVVIIGVTLVGILKIYQFRISENIQQKIFVRSSFEFVYRFPHIKTALLNNESSRDLANRFFDTIHVQKGIGKFVVDTLTAVLQILFGVLLLTFYHVYFVFFGLFIIIFLVLIFYFGYVEGLNTSLKESKIKYKVAHWIQEVARNYLGFKNKSAFDFALFKNDKLVKKYLTYREDHFRALRKQFVQLTVFKVVITGVLLLVGGILVINQKMNIGQFVAAEIIIITIVMAVEKLFAGLELFYDLLTSLEKLGSFTDIALEEDKASLFEIENKPIAIEAGHLSFKFPNSEYFLFRDLNFKINAGEKVLISGRNGSGKTTLLRILARLIEPTDGQFLINGMNYKKYGYDDYRSHIGVLTTNDTPFEGTIYENIICGNKHISLDDLQKIIKFLDLDDIIKELDYGLNTPLYSDGTQVNSSTLQKIMLARCLINKPNIIFLEEPVDKIDAEYSQKIVDALTDESFKATVVIVSNDDRWRTRCNRIITLENGQIINS